jgi:hypothetical protein
VIVETSIRIWKALCASSFKFTMEEFAAAVDDVDVRTPTSRHVVIVVEADVFVLGICVYE